MKWKNRRQSQNVEDRRGRSVKTGGKIGGVGLVIVLLLSFVIGGPEAVINNLGTILAESQQTEYVPTEQSMERAEFAKVVLADTEDVWNGIFEQMGKKYIEPTLVLYSGRVQSACGHASSAVGPFYCPGDQKIYLDLSFYDELANKLGASGDFAMAYVIAHEAGHHVQTQLGVSKKLNEIRKKVSKKEYNRYSVAFELQADYLAGVYARHAQKMGYLEDGDLLEAFGAAQAVGDDRLQKQAQGYVVPDSFTHGTSEQRLEWFKKGYEAGNLDDWDTFEVVLRK